MYSQSFKQIYIDFIKMETDLIRWLGASIRDERKDVGKFLMKDVGYGPLYIPIGSPDRIRCYEQQIKSATKSIQFYKSFLMIDESYLVKIKQHLLDPESWELTVSKDKIDVVKLTAEETRDRFINHVKHLIEIGWDLKNGFEMRFLDNKTLKKSPLLSEAVNKRNA